MYYSKDKQKMRSGDESGQVSFVVIGNFDVTEACKLQEVQV
jgi:hypothetical protein